MCGICGLLDMRQAPDLAVLRRMNGSLAHRGPDDEGYYYSSATSPPYVALGHRRLSIIDLGGGHQPMPNEDGSVQAVFNGELYNFQELSSTLQAKGHQFRTRSDTEALVHAYEEWGEDCLSRCNGMFAFAIWDERKRRLFAARDRMGKKPFYYSEAGGRFSFASEAKALLHGGVEARLNPEALSEYLTLEYVPSPLCIFKGIHKLAAGHFLIWQDGSASVHRYWEVSFPSRQSVRSEQACVEELRWRLNDAVRRRLISDVPLGVFLSGGLDSSAIVALMAESIPPGQIKTFSIGFEDSSYDESEYARLVVAHFRTDHHEQILRPERMIEILPELTAFLDEPFGDASIVPTYLLAKFTRQHVTVALSGDGGDELFAGYPTFQAERMAQWYESMPPFLDRIVRTIAARLPVSHDNLSFDFRVKQFLAGMRYPSMLRNQAWIGSFPPSDQESLLTADVRAESSKTNAFDRIRVAEMNCDDPNWLHRMIYLYFKFYLQDDILFKADRASMAASLEVRAPFLDFELVEYVNSLPPRLKLRGLQTKYVLKQAMKQRLPQQILRRKKKGFGIPIARWFRRELRELMLDVLSPSRLRQGGIFEPAAVSRLVEEHLQGQRDHRKQLWTLLSFELWRDQYLRKPATPPAPPPVLTPVLGGTS